MTSANDEATGSPPLLSVLIPTRNRCATLVHTVGNVLACGEDLEVVVHDTSDTTESEEALSARFPGERRLRYVYSAPPMSFAETFDKVVSLARGRFVTIIGDDDGMTAAVIEATELAEARGWDAITPTLPASYNWPDFRHLYYGDADAGRLSVRSFTGEVSRVDPLRELVASARGGFQRFDRLPRIYYGIVRRSCLVELREAAGACFFGASPDISGAVGLAQFVHNMVRLDYPIFLPGSSARSGAGLSGMKQHSGSLAETPQTAAFAATWPREVPPVYAVQTVWAQAALSTLDAVDLHGARAHFSVGEIHSQTLVHNPHFARLVIASLGSALARGVGGRARTVRDFVAGGLKEAAIRARGLFYRVFKQGYYRYDYTSVDLTTIEEAVANLEAHLATQGTTFSATVTATRPSGA